MKKLLLKLSMLSIIFGLAFLVSCEKDDLKPDKEELTIGLRSASGNTITYSVDTICLGDSLTVTFDNGYGNDNDCGKIMLQMNSDTGWVQVAMGTPVSGSLTYTFTPDSADNYLFRGMFNPNPKPKCTGQENMIQFEEGTATSHVVVTNDCCELSFTGEKTVCQGEERQVEYIFIAGEDMDSVKIQGGLTNFTKYDPDAVVIVTGGNMTDSQRTPGGSSNRVITVEGSVEACDTVKIQITWFSTNDDNTITGEWTVSASEDPADIVDGLLCN
jgi:hypothetical protein